MDLLVKAREQTLQGAKRFSIAIKSLFVKSQDSVHGQTPIHFAYKNGNIELVICIFNLIKKNCTNEKENDKNAGSRDLINEILNVTDYVS